MRMRFFVLCACIMLLGLSNVWADAVSCRNEFPLACPFDYSSTGRPVVIQLKDFNCVAEGGTVPDDECWQLALSCGFRQADGRGDRTFAIEATEGVTYSINETICLTSTSDARAYGPIINGNGARLVWFGPANSLSPMFFFGSVTRATIENMKIQSTPEHPMHSAIVFGNLPYQVSSTNTVRNVTIEGTNTNGLDYGVRLAGAESFEGNPLGLRDIMNDLFTFQEVDIHNVMKAGISIEHTQAYSHQLIGVQIYAADGNELEASDDCLWSLDGPCPEYIMGGSGVRLLAGSFDSFGGYIGGFGNAAYFIKNAEGAVTIVNHHSEACAHLLRSPLGATGFGGEHVSILGGRFAAHEINPEGRIIDWYRPNQLRIDGLSVDGFSSSQLKFHLSPHIISAAPDLTSVAEISHVHMYVAGSRSWPDIFEMGNPTRTHLVSVGNLCYGTGDQGQPAYAGPCPGLGGGTDQAVGKLAGKDLTDSSNLFPATLTTDTEWDSVSEINAMTADGDFATLGGPEALANKDLSSDTNWTSPTGTVPFVAALSKNMAVSQYCPPYSGSCNGTESAVWTAHPALRPRSFYCKVSTAPGTGKSWTFKARAGGTDLLVCEIAGTGKTCQVLGGSPPEPLSRWAEGAAVSLKVEPTGAALPSSSATCVLGVGP